MRAEDLLIRNNLERLAVWYTDPTVEEIAINRPGEAWLRIRKPAPGEPVWQPREDPELSMEYLSDVCHLLANYRGIPFDPQSMPALYTMLPGGHRFTAVLGAAVLWDQQSTEGVAMAIRQYTPEESLTVADYANRPAEAQRERALRFGDGPIDIQAALDIIKAGGSALIAGATSTGKTRFLNILLREYLPATHRIVSLEDTAELVIPQPNRVPIILSRTEQTTKLDYAKAVDLVVRMTPDVVLCGEVSTRNAGTVYELLETGHRNFLATIHGESAAGGLRAFLQRLWHTNPGMDQDSTLDTLAGGLDMVIHLDRSGNVRFHNEIVRTRDLVKAMRSGRA